MKKVILMKYINLNLISERHRHRYEFNNEYRKQITEAGMKIVGTSPDDRLVEIVEVEESSMVCSSSIPSRIEIKTK